MIGFNNQVPISKSEIYALETEYYNKRIIKDNREINKIDFSNILNRNVECYVDKDFNLPQNIFFIKLPNGLILFGRKVLSVLHRNKQLTSLNCSRIDANMLIGIAKDWKYKSPNILVEFYPLDDAERQYIFDTIKCNNRINIFFPFTYRDYVTKEEKSSPKEGWHYYENLDIYLARGEKHIRKETIDFLSNEKLNMETIIYDPACSTGNFLEDIKNHFPYVFTIGADLSQEMIDVATPKLDVALCENAYNSSICNNCVDYLFLRFLNFHVVTKKEALEMYKILLNKVKTNGKIICFGHTPVLLSQEDLIGNQCVLNQSSAYDSEYNSKFQYYVLTKKR